MTSPNLLIRGAVVGSNAVMGEGLKIASSKTLSSLRTPLCTLIASCMMDTIVPSQISITQKLVKGCACALASSLASSIAHEPSSGDVNFWKLALISSVSATSYIICSKMFGDE